VQAGTVYGGITVHGRSEPPPPPPRQLPRAAAGFVNRERALADLDAFLPRPDDPPLTRRAAVVTTIAGAPGVGKTALAVHWAHRARRWFTDGDLYVDMRGYGPGTPLGVEQVLDAFLRALHVSAQRIPAEVDARAALYRSMLEGKRILVLIDNAASEGQVRPLLPAASTCMAIVTSRSRLSGLVAREGASRMTLDVLSAEEALGLLRDTIGPGRVDAELQAAAELARRCAYLPLALRIIAERISNSPHTSLADFAVDLARADSQLDALHVDEDELSDVRAVFSWSYRALTENTARMFRLLGVHVGADISTAAAATVAGLTIARTRSLLDALTAAHLLQNPARDRYVLHDLLRVYAAERADADETPEQLSVVRRRLYSWYLGMAEEGRKVILPYSQAVPLSPVAAGVQLVPPATVDEAMRWFEQERLNLLDMIRQAEQLGEYDVAWQLPVVSDGFWELKSYWSDWCDIHLIGLRAARAIGDRYGEASNLRCLGDAYWRTNQREQALDCYRRGVDASRAAGAPWVEGFCLRGCGLIYEELGLIDEALEYYAQALNVFRVHGIVRGEGMSLLSLGNCYRALGRTDDAIVHHQQAVAIFEQLDDQWSIAWACHPLGLAYQQAGQFIEAREQQQRALRLFRAFGDRRCEGTTLAALGDTVHALGDTVRAQRCWQDALLILDELADPHADTVRARLDPLDSRG
jgi:tetratricopeptide (TPR) repeat protein